MCVCVCVCMRVCMGVCVWAGACVSMFAHRHAQSRDGFAHGTGTYVYVCVRMVRVYTHVTHAFTHILYVHLGCGEAALAG